MEALIKYDMQYFQQLSLPTPLKDDVVEELTHLKRTDSGPNGIRKVNYQTIHYDVERFLNPALLDMLLTVGLKPVFFLHFGALDLATDRSSIHRDLFRENGEWVPVPAGIMWDLTPGTTDFKWYDTSNVLEILPPEHLGIQLADFNSAHYGRRFGVNVSDCKLLDHLALQRNTPYLVRTDTPHQVNYVCDTDTRVSINVRFATKDIPTWERALELFKPFFCLTWWTVPGSNRRLCLARALCSQLYQQPN